MSAAALLYLYVESPLHAGTGGGEGETAHLPIQRDETTADPIIRAGTCKGVLRSQAAALRPAAEVAAVFGPDPEAPPEDAVPAALTVGDARLLVFPVRALNGIFAWVTSEGLLARFRRDAEHYLGTVPLPLAIPAPPAGTAWVAAGSQVVNRKGQVVLEEIAFQGEERPEVRALARWLVEQAFPSGETFAYWREKAARDLVVLPEEALRHFVLESTERITRIRIDPQTGVAAEGSLWEEEYVPAETIFYLPLAAQSPARPVAALPGPAEVLDWLRGLGCAGLQFGGGRTLGRGLVRLRWAGQ
jgi:CRISPR-associated protein Cmr4